MNKPTVPVHTLKWTLSTQLKIELDTSACSFTHALKQSVQQLQTDWTDRELSPQALPTQLKTEFYTSICSFTHVYNINFVIYFFTYALKQSNRFRQTGQAGSVVGDWPRRIVCSWWRAWRAAGTVDWIPAAAACSPRHSAWPASCWALLPLTHSPPPDTVKATPATLHQIPASSLLRT